MSDNLYDILGVKRNATLEQIKLEFNKRCNYVRSSRDIKEKEEQLDIIFDAFNILSNPIRREIYDVFLKIDKRKVKNKRALNYFKANYHILEPFFEMFSYKIKVIDNKLAVYDMNDRFIDYMMIYNKEKLNLEAELKVGDTTFIYIGELVLSNGSNGMNVYNSTIGLRRGTKIVVVEIERDTFNNDVLPQIKINVLNTNAIYKYSSIYMNSTSFGVEISSQTDLSDDTILGIKRSFIYDNASLGTLYPSSFQYEEHNGETLHYMLFRDSGEDEPFGKILEVNGFTDNILTASRKYAVPEPMAQSFTKEILFYERVQNLINYIMNDMEKTLPGLKKHFNKHYGLYSQIDSSISHLGNIFQPNSNLYDSLSDYFPVSYCDLPNEKKESSKGQYKKRKLK